MSVLSRGTRERGEEYKTDGEGRRQAEKYAEKDRESDRIRE